MTARGCPRRRRATRSPLALLVAALRAVAVAARGDDARHFNLRLYWRKGYKWQERTSERFWCLQCKVNRCPKGSRLKIERCDRGDWRQHFYFDDGRIRSRRNRDVCVERSGRSMKLRGCSDARGQVWAELRKDRPFQLRPPGESRKCASQHHHPKEGEKVYMTSCKKSEESQSDKWIVY